MIISIKKILGSLFLGSGLIRLFRRHRLTILTFHNPNIDEFEKQIRYIKKHYTVVGAKDVLDFYNKNKKLPRNPLLITFDDGYANIRTFVEPVMKKHGLRPLVFVPTELIDEKKFAWYDKVEYLLHNTKKKSIRLGKRTHPNDEKLLKIYYEVLTHSEKEVREAIIKDLALQSGVRITDQIPDRYRFLTWKDIKVLDIDIGSHSISHPIMTYLDREKISHELLGSKEKLEKRGLDSYSFCFPNGDYNQITIEETRKAGYDLAFTCDPGFNDKHTDPLMLKRIGVNEKDDTGILSLKLAGFFNWINYWRQYRDRQKIILATNYYFPQLGGITTTVNRLEKNLKKLGLDVAVYPFPHAFRIVEDRLPGWAYQIGHRLMVMIYIINGLLMVAWHRLRLKKVVVHGHSANFCGFYSYLAGFLGARTVFTFHTDPRMEGLIYQGSKEKKKVWYLDRIEHLTSVSNNLANSSRHYFGIRKDIDTIYCGIDLVYRKSDRKNCVLFVGNLIDIKDPMTFVRAVEILQKKGVDFSAKIIGTGELETEMKNYIKKKGLKIKMLGRLSMEETIRNYIECKVYVCTSLGEGLSNTIMEALRAGCRIVATDVGGTPEFMIEENGLGTLVKPKDPDAIANAIIKELDKKSNIDKKYLKRFDIENVAMKYMSIYKKNES